MFSTLLTTPKPLKPTHRGQMTKLENKHKATAPNHKGNVVRFTRKNFNAIYASKCSYCSTHLEVRK